MLYRELLTSELHNQRHDFQHFAETQASDLTAFLHILHELQQTASAEINEKLSKQENSVMMKLQIMKKPETGQEKF